jgi:hypothetical protein
MCKVNNSNEGGCWHWQAGTNDDGYGKFRWGKQMIGSHRASYMIFVGDIPENKIIAHKCDNPPCVNPDHLWLADIIENVQDRDRKLRTGRGEKNRHAKLKESQVMEIKKLIEQGKNNTQIAAFYPVDRSVISRIRHKKAWSFV